MRPGESPVPLHNDIFLSPEATIHVLVGKNEIEKSFVWHLENKSREEAIEAYIGVPVPVCNRKIPVLLQIDCNMVKGFGATKEESQLFAPKTIRPYAAFLSMIYEFDRMNEVTNYYIYLWIIAQHISSIILEMHWQNR